MFTKSFVQTHLPNELYEQVKDLKLLDGAPHQFVLVVDGEPQSLEIQLIAHKKTLDNKNESGPNLDAVELSFKELNGDGFSHLFEKQVNVLVAIVDKGVETTQGRDDLCLGEAGSSPEECKKETPRITKGLLDILKNVKQGPAIECNIM